MPLPPQARARAGSEDGHSQRLGFVIPGQGNKEYARNLSKCISIALIAVSHC